MKEGKHTLNYGMKEKLLAANLGSTVEHALGIIDKYMTKYPSVRRFFTSASETTRKTGYAFSILGRRRNLPAINSHVDYHRFQAERQATNMEIQGSAADLVRLAMLALDDAAIDERFGAELVLQVHDELVHDCPKETAREAQKEITEIMEDALWSKLPVKFSTDTHIAESWYDAK